MKNIRKEKKGNYSTPGGSEPLGADYESLNGTRDSFERHLRNLIIDNFGEIFATNNISFCFHTIENKDVLQVDVIKGEKPVYFVTTNKNGVKDKKFYVRSGNTSQALDIEDVYEYIKSRFN